MELELTVTLDDDAKGEHCSQFSFSVDYDGDGVESAFLCSASPKQKLNTLKLLPFLHIPKPSIHFSTVKSMRIKIVGRWLVCPLSCYVV